MMNVMSMPFLHDLLVSNVKTAAFLFHCELLLADIALPRLARRENNSTCCPVLVGKANCYSLCVDSLVLMRQHAGS